MQPKHTKTNQDNAGKLLHNATMIT